MAGLREELLPADCPNGRRRVCIVKDGSTVDDRVVELAEVETHRATRLSQFSRYFGDQLAVYDVVRLHDRLLRVREGVGLAIAEEQPGTQAIVAVAHLRQKTLHDEVTVEPDQRWYLADSREHAVVAHRKIIAQRPWQPAPQAAGDAPQNGRRPRDIALPASAAIAIGLDDHRPIVAVAPTHEVIAHAALGYVGHAAVQHSAKLAGAGH